MQETQILLLQDDVDLEDELMKQNIGFCVYANLNERAYHNESKGYDRSKDDPNVSFIFDRGLRYFYQNVRFAVKLYSRAVCNQKQVIILRVVLSSMHNLKILQL